MVEGGAVSNWIVLGIAPAVCAAIYFLLNWAQGAYDPPCPPLGVVSWFRLEDGDYVIKLNSGRTYRGECTLWYDFNTAQVVDHGETRDALMRFEKLIEWGRLDDKRIEERKRMP